MTESRCVHVVIQGPSLVVRASHECLGLFHRANSEPLVVDALESAIDRHILLTLSLENMVIQINALHTHSLTINYHIQRNALCCIGYYLLLINQTIYLGSEPHEFGDGCPLCSSLKMGPDNFLLKLRNDVREWNLLLSTSCS